MTLQLKTPHIKVSKTVLFVTLAVLAFGAIVVFGAWQSVRQQRAEAEASQAKAEQTAAVLKQMDTLKAENAALKKEALTETNTVLASCAEFRRLDADRVITFRVSVPAYCAGR